MHVIEPTLESFAENTMRYLRDEGHLLSEGIDFPPLQTRFRDRHALVVARGPGYKRDLRMVTPYIRDFKPVLIAVDLVVGTSAGALAGAFFLAGDSAHVNSPIGAMGMNSGIHDAFNLAEKLITILRKEAPDDVLDRYERQRRHVALIEGAKTVLAELGGRAP